MWGFETADEKLAAVGDVDVDVAVHGVLAEEVDAEFLSCFGEAPLSVEREDIREDAAAAVVVGKFKEFAC